MSILMDLVNFAADRCQKTQNLLIEPEQICVAADIVKKKYRRMVLMMVGLDVGC